MKPYRSPRSCSLGRCQVSLHAHRAALLPHALLEDLTIDGLRCALPTGTHAQPLPCSAAVARQEEADFGPRQSRQEHGLADVSCLGPRRLEKLAPCGNVEEKVAYFDARTLRRARRSGPARAAPFDEDLRAFERTAGAGNEAQLGYRRDARQSLATEAEGVQREEIILRLELAGRVPFEGQHRVFCIHACPVVGHAHEGYLPTPGSRGSWWRPRRARSPPIL